MNMSEQQFLEKLGEILEVETFKLVPDTPLESISGWDSIGQITTLGFLDETFSVQPPTGYLATCRTVADVMALVREYLSL